MSELPRYPQCKVEATKFGAFWICPTHGQLPKPKVLPNVTELANRAGNNAVQGQGQKYLGKIFGKKGLPGGLGKFLGGDSGGNNGSSGSGAPAGNPPPNPLDQLKKLF